MKKIKFNALNVITVVIICAMLGMFMGGIFGVFAGNIAPDFFANLWNNRRPLKYPVGIAVIMGSFGGVILGGSLGGFAIVVQLIDQFFLTRKEIHQMKQEKSSE